MKLLIMSLGLLAQKKENQGTEQGLLQMDHEKTCLQSNSPLSIHIQYNSDIATALPSHTFLVKTVVMSLSKGCLFGKLSISNKAFLWSQGWSFSSSITLSAFKHLFRSSTLCTSSITDCAHTTSCDIFLEFFSEKMLAYPSNNKQTRSAMHCPIFYLVMANVLQFRL